ncbi:MAG TPA: HAD family phosphatase [Bacillota bacterium]|nr:HAD family phosphatase [Bacillota bacterium]
MIKNIVFDMGNVMIEFNPIHYLSDIIEDPSVVEKVYQEMFCNMEWQELDRGAISEAEALASISTRIPEYTGYVKQVMTTWFNKLKPIEGMYELVQDLKQRGYRIYLLSNASPRIYEYMDNIPAFQFFDGYLISCDIKVNKPDQEIYESLMRKYQLIANECIFIDDLPQNIEGAKSVGWQGYVFNGAADLKRFFKEQHILE